MNNRRWTPETRALIEQRKYESDLESGRMVECAPIREAVIALVFSEYGPSWTDLCRRLGWMEQRRDWNGVQGEVTRLKRTIGYVPGGGKGRGWKLRRLMTYDNAVKIVEAIDADPVDYGL
jgi:hypothetical protein